jgi:hypothetical protein
MSNRYMTFRIKHIVLGLSISLMGFVCMGQELSFVAAPNGLNLRDQPSLSGKVISLVEFGTLVTIQQGTGQFITVKDDDKIVRGEWVKIHFRDQNKGYLRGFLFDGFLTDDKSLVINYDSILHQGSKGHTGYSIKNIFELTKKLKVKAGPISEISKTLRYEFGDIEYSEEETIPFDACSEQDAIILFSNLRDYWLDKETVDWTDSQKINDIEEQVSFENTKSHFWEDQITVVRNIITGEIIRISRATRGEGGGGGGSIVKKAKNKWVYSTSSFAD